MPVTEPPKADYAYVFRRLTKYLGAADPNAPSGDAVNPHSPYTADILKKTNHSVRHRNRAADLFGARPSVSNRIFYRNP